MKLPTSVLLFLILLCIFGPKLFPRVEALKKTKQQLRLEVQEMIHHAYDNYMQNAYPGDELMPLSCQGRVRGMTSSRGDIDDALGNFALTLIDSLDTLAVMGDLDRFESGVKRVIEDVKFDSNLVVSVFETNIRVLGGLISAHVMSRMMKHEGIAMSWYKDELLYMGIELANRLLPAFNTSTGVPHSRVNLKYGVHHPKAGIKHDGTTCTACAGTFLLEFAALSRLMGDSVYETKARTAMDYLWSKRSLTSDLVGTILNVKTGEWIKKHAGLGAGIDSYYEYIFKYYILQGDLGYLDRFNKHYDAIKKYILDGPLLLNVNMQKPEIVYRSHLDALSAFWPAIQVLKGDLKSAIEVHEVFYQVIKQHKFLPEAFNSQFKTVWNHHPIRPEFVESTYFLYKATGDTHYLDVAEYMVEAIQNFTRVPCGFAAISNVLTFKKEDRFDSFVLAETFKYLYLIFTSDDELWFDVENFVFTTEAHLIPLNWKASYLAGNSSHQSFFDSRFEKSSPQAPLVENEDELYALSTSYDNTCQNFDLMNNPFYALDVRKPLWGFVMKDAHRVNADPPLCSNGDFFYDETDNGPRVTVSSTAFGGNFISTPKDFKPITVQEFDHSNSQHVSILSMMGIQLVQQMDGSLQLTHRSEDAINPSLGQMGLRFITDMWKLNEQSKAVQKVAVVQILSAPYYGSMVFKVGGALFGYDLSVKPEISGYVVVASPFDACTVDELAPDIEGFIVLAQRGNCLFAEKARAVEERGAVGIIVMDNVEDTSVESNELFSLSVDNNPKPIHIPTVFAYHKEGIALLALLKHEGKLLVRLAGRAESFEVLEQYYDLKLKFTEFWSLKHLHKYSEYVFENDDEDFEESLKSYSTKADKVDDSLFADQATEEESFEEDPGGPVEFVLNGNSVEVEQSPLQGLPPPFSMAKAMIIKHIILMGGRSDISDAFDNLDSEINDASLAAVFYNEIPTLGMRVSMVVRSGRAKVSLMDSFKEEFKQIVKQFRAQGFLKIQIDRMANGVARLKGVNTAKDSFASSDDSLDYENDKFLADLLDQVVESVHVDLYSSKVTVN